jgi:hypothetical protein
VVLLEISEYESLEGPSTEELRLSFRYRLRECRETQFFLAKTNGGLNVDNGRVEMTWAEDRLRIVATKSLRYAATRELSTEETLLLNMLGPATLSMLVQRLAFDGPLDFLDKFPNGVPRADERSWSNSPEYDPCETLRAREMRSSRPAMIEP